MTAAKAVGIVAGERARLGVEDTPAKKAPAGSSTPAPAKKATPAPAKKATKKAPARRRPPVSKTTAKRTAKKLARPMATAGGGDVAGLLVATVSIILLYRVVVRHPDKVPGFLGGLTSALTWLRSPTAIIEFGDSPP